MPREFELKFEVEPSALDRLKAAPLFRAALERSSWPQRLISVYFDTPKHALRNAGLTLRVRRAGRRYVQTVKSSTDGQILERFEWEGAIKGPDPDLSLVEGSPLNPLLERKSVRERLAPVFCTIVDRVNAVVAEDGAVIEVSADLGKVEAGSRSAQLCELEIELKSGEVTRVFDLARDLSELAPMRVGARSKSERGYALLDGEPGPAKAEVPLLHRSMTAGQAFRIVAHSCLRQLLLNEALLREHRDPDVLHQARVGTRRLRAAISLFKSTAADDRRDAINGELRWIAGLLGEARDLDVFLAQSLEPRDGSLGAHPAQEAARYHQGRREAAYDQVLEALASQRFRSLALDTLAWIEAGPWRTKDDPEAVTRRTMLIDDHVGRVLARRRKAIVRRGASLRELDDEARHEVRIAAKKLRYASEFLVGLYRGKRRKQHKTFVAALEELQARLGDLNDIAKAEELSDAGRLSILQAAGAQEEAGPDEVAARRKAILKKASRAYEVFAETKPFWR